MLKVSVATRCPFTNLPKDPESTAWAEAALAWFFLSAAGAETAKETAASKATAWTIRKSNFTRLLLVGSGSRSSSNPALRRSRRQSPRKRDLPFESCERPASSAYAWLQKVREIGRCCAATGVPSLFRRPVSSTAARVPRPVHPGRPLARWTFPAEPHCFPGQTRRRPRLRL